MKNTMGVVALALFMFHGSLAADGKRMFVSPTGNDGNDGLTTGAPFATITHGVNLLTPGDTLYLLPGTYHEYVRVLQRKGLPEKPMCIFGYSPQQRPVIDGGASVPSNSNTTNYWMDIETSQWIEVGNIEFRNGWTNPIKVVNSSYVTFTDCAFYGGKRIINLSGVATHHALIQRCFWDQGGNALWTIVSDSTGVDAWTSMHEGILQYYNGSLVNIVSTGGSVIIRDNTIVNAFNAIRWTATKDYDSNIEIYNNTVSNVRDNDFEPEYYTYNLHIYHNNSHNIHRTLSVDHVEGGYIYYYGNMVSSDNDAWSNEICSGFWKVYGEGTTNVSLPMYAFNNSFCGVGKAFSMDAGTIAINVKHFNNAYYFTGSRGWVLDNVDSTDKFDFDISNKAWPSNITNKNQETHGKIGDAGFKNSAAFDLRLQPGSPSIDAGVALSIPELGWTQPYRGIAPDIGAFEGDTLVDGPPFRFKTWPGLFIQYAEKPRIVRSKISGNGVTVYFSSPLDSATISASNILLAMNATTLHVVGAVLSDGGYRLDISADPGSALNDSTLALGFEPLPKGTNGETATLWGSTVKAYRTSIPVYVSDKTTALNVSRTASLDIYPNPFNNAAKISFRFPGFSGSSGSLGIYDLLGRKVKETEFVLTGSEGALAITDDGLASGTYIAVVRAGGQVLSQKFMVIK